ncbi:MAG TPA: carboxypeptidase regulatory-like domain-containing protein [Ignavibacteriaceae bacterium]|nr:carboxypeptidase regulatory-like domain-containing protein [Ignavibacteriaceae bacterium]
MKKTLTKISFLLIAALFLSLQSLGFAQVATTASISGTITDQNGNALPAASIIAVHVPTGTQYGTTSRTDGKYNLIGLKVGGPYEITISYVGYQKQTQTISKLELGQSFALDATMTETAVEISGVTVTADRNAIISDARTGSSQNVSTKQLEELPTIGRSFQTFAKLSPLFSGQNLQAAGRSNRYNNIQIDGTQYNDLFGLGSTGTPGGQTGTNPISLDAIQEFQVVIAPYDVRLGGFTGGGINAITRSGTNELHGSAFAYGRNQKLVGKYYNNIDNPVSDFKEWQYGVRLGGPIMKDKLFFFINGEITGRNEPTANLSLSTGPTNTETDAKTIQTILAGRGFNTGGYAPFTTKQPSGKLFARLDFNLADNHKLSLHYNYVNATQDILNSRSSSSSFSFDTYLYQIKDITNNIVAQLNSTFGNNMANELIIGYTTIRDKRGPEGTLTPEVQVRQPGITYEMGTDRFSSANKLDQNVFEITDNFSYFFGDHTFTVGTHNEFFSFTNLFLRSFAGYYQYNTLADLQNGNVSFYQRVAARAGKDPAANFPVRQYGFYAQDDWQVKPNFKVSFGLRVDIPTFPDKPYQNDSVSTYFSGYSTNTAPSGNLLWAPRVGFNWDVFSDKTTQVRGGIGIFTGRPAYVWISNQYGNTGVSAYEVNGSGTNLFFSPDGKNLPDVGDPGTGAASFRSEIDLADPKLKMPQVLRYDIGIDHQLPMGFIGTVEFQYSKSTNDFVYNKLNIINHDSPTALLQDGRPYYGGTDSKNNNFTDVMYLKNTNEGYSYNISFQLQRNVQRGISINTGYTYGRAKDLNSVNSSQANSQMRYNPIAGDPNSPVLATSQYEIRGRVFVSLSYTEEFIENAPTTISLFYNGESGAPFSYIYGSDINNDGFDQNDLFYIPKDNSDILLGSLTGGAFVSNSSMYTAFNNFVSNNPYLASHKGQIAERNADSNPWVNYVDIHIAQDIPIIKGHTLTINYDILNLMNLLNSDWGWNSSVFSTYRVANKVGTVTAAGPDLGKNVYSFSAPSNNTPFTPSNFSSRWQMQLGVRYSF